MPAKSRWLQTGLPHTSEDCREYQLYILNSGVVQGIAGAWHFSMFMHASNPGCRVKQLSSTVARFLDSVLSEEHPMKMAHGSVCLPTSSGRKDDMAVILPELSRTASLLKQWLGACIHTVVSLHVKAKEGSLQCSYPDRMENAYLTITLRPLPFMDKPAALFLLVDGLRQSNLAAEWCAKRFHTHLLPRLSAPWLDNNLSLLSCFKQSAEAYHSEPEDSELVAVVREARHCHRCTWELHSFRAPRKLCPERP